MRLSLYVPGDTWLHRLDPLTKLFLTGVGISLTLILHSLPGGTALFLVLLFVLASGGTLRPTLPVYAGMSIIAATFVIVQSLVHPDNVHPLFAAGPIVFYREGFVVGLRLVLRLYCILSATLILVLATNPSDLTESIVRRGAHPRVGYVIIAVLQIIPTMISASRSITDAQRSRGMETEGRLWTRLRAFMPLLGPLVTSSLIATEERALALEVRGFGGNNRPTFLKKQHVPPHSFTAKALSTAALVLALVGRWRWGW